ncbi:MAG: DUF2911 domain-containing protein [Gemmatimonadaceae bacterium]
MYSILVALIALSGWTAQPVELATVRPMGEERAGFVTTLGRDTVALESFTRTGSHVDGDIVVRVPGTVLCHYSVDMSPTGTVTRTLLDIKPLGTSEVHARRVTLEFGRDSVRVTVDSSGHKQTATRALEKAEFPLFMTGFGSSFGLYSSLGMYELFLSHVSPTVNDTVAVRSVDMASGRVSTRRFIRRTPTLVDVDYFGILWTHLTSDSAGHVMSADASATTEKTQSQRTAFLDVPRAADAFAAADRAGKGIGVASPNEIERDAVGGQTVVATYGSPRKRGRVILGNVVPYDRIWRTGANEATVLVFDHDLSIAGTTLPAGAYSIWTLPERDGTVQLIINKQHGQWGTDYDPAQDVVRIPMQVTVAPTPSENMAISINGSGNASQLRISWDTFVWSVPVALK